jgi:uncharacterized membrane protein
MTNKLIQSTIAAFITLVAAENSIAANETPPTEKCYGVAKSGMNDCQTTTSSCAGSSTKDSQPDAFILLPKGICERLVGGHLTSSNKN